MAKEPQQKKKRFRLFTRALLPPARFHSTKRGKRGYERARIRKEERQAKGEVSGPG